MRASERVYSKREETPPSMQAPELAIISWRQLATEQKRDPAWAIYGDDEMSEFPVAGMKLPTLVEQGQTEHKVLHQLRLAAQRNPA